MGDNMSGLEDCVQSHLRTTSIPVDTNDSIMMALGMPFERPLTAYARNAEIANGNLASVSVQRNRDYTSDAGVECRGSRIQDDIKNVPAT